MGFIGGGREEQPRTLRARGEEEDEEGSEDTTHSQLQTGGAVLQHKPISH